MRLNTARCVAVFTTLLTRCTGFTVTTNNDDAAVANAIFNGPGVTVIYSDSAFASGSIGTFTDGPFGIGNGGLLTSGVASGALPGGDQSVDNGFENNGQGDFLCATNSRNPDSLYVQIRLASGYNGIRIQLIMATEETTTYDYYPSVSSSGDLTLAAVVIPMLLAFRM